MSELKVTSISHPSASAAGITLGSDGSVALPSGFTGGIGANVVSTKVTSNFSTSSTSFVPITGASATITLTSASSRVLVLFSARRQSNDQTNGYVAAQVERAGTSLAITEQRHTSANYGMNGPIMTATETPGSVGPHTYTVEASNAGVSGTVTIQQPMYLTVIEVAA